MAIIGIVAVAKNLAIGRGGKLPWHYSSDLKFFKQTTSGNAVVMGFNTWKSIGRPLPNRLNIIISRSHSVESQPNVLLMRSRDEVLALSRFLGCNVFIIGGAETYKAFAEDIETWLVTEVPETVDDADAFMPAGFHDAFEISGRTELEPGLAVVSYVKPGS